MDGLLSMGPIPSGYILEEDLDKTKGCIKKMSVFSQLDWRPDILLVDPVDNAQTALAVIGNIAFPSGRNKGKITSFTFTGDELTQSRQ